METVFSSHQVERVHHTQDHKIFKKKTNYNINNNYSCNSRQKSPNYYRDGNRSGQLFSGDRLRNVNKSSFLNSKPYYENKKIKPPDGKGSSYTRRQNFKKNLDNNNYFSFSRPQSHNSYRNRNRSRRLFSSICLLHVRNYINSL